MKARMFFYLVGLVSISIVAISAFGQNQFVRTLGGTYHDYGRSGIEVSNGELVVTGYISRLDQGI